MNEHILNGKDNQLLKTDKLSRMTELMREIITLTNDSFSEKQEKELIEKTPQRFVRYLLEATEGYNASFDDAIGDALFDVDDYKDIIIVNNISFNSTCEHHLLPFFGECSIGYIPGKKVLGLSKFPRFIEILSKRLYLQENFTRDIATKLDSYLKSSGIVVIVNAKHTCMCCRGIKSFNSETQTIHRTGLFLQTDYLNQFYSLLNLKSNK